MSLVAPIVPVLVPPDALKTTVSPPAVRLLPAASLACKVSVIALPEATVPLAAETVEVAVEAGPGVTVIEAVELTAFPPIVALSVVVVPAVTPVKLAV